MRFLALFSEPNKQQSVNFYLLRVYFFFLLVGQTSAQFKNRLNSVFSKLFSLSYLLQPCVFWLVSVLFLFTVADKLEKSESIPVEKVRLTERPENLSSNSEILDWDIYQYYKFLAERGDVQIQVMYTDKFGFLEMQITRGLVVLSPKRVNAPS